MSIPELLTPVVLMANAAVMVSNARYQKRSQRRIAASMAIIEASRKRMAAAQQVIK